MYAVNPLHPYPTELLPPLQYVPFKIVSHNRYYYFERQAKGQTMDTTQSNTGGRGIYTTHTSYTAYTACVTYTLYTTYITCV